MGCAQSNQEILDVEENDRIKEANFKLKNSVIYLASLEDLAEQRMVQLKLKEAEGKLSLS